MAKSRYSEEVYRIFREEREEFFKEHFAELFQEEVFIHRDNKKIRLNVIDKNDLYGLAENSYVKLACDYQFCLTVSYKHYFEFSFKEVSWIEKKERFQENYISSPYLRAIFRDEVDFPWRAMIERLKKNKINLICLKKYKGGLSEKEFIQKLIEQDIYVKFVK